MTKRFLHSKNYANFTPGVVKTTKKNQLFEERDRNTNRTFSKSITKSDKVAQLFEAHENSLISDIFMYIYVVLLNYVYKHSKITI